MKLLLCPECGDIFNLAKGRIKTCYCGGVGGRYLDDGLHAEVNGEGYSLAMDSRELSVLISYWSGNGKKSLSAWARPHSGEINPHTEVKPGLLKDELPF